MKHPFLSFLAVVVVPAGVCMTVAHALATDAWLGMRTDAHARVAGMVLRTTAVELRERDPGAADTFRLGAPARAGRSAGYHTAVYLDGRRSGGSEPAIGPEAVPPEVAGVLRPGQPVRVGHDPSAGVWVAAEPETGLPERVALAVPRSPAPPLLAAPVILVMALLLLFGALTGWIQLARRDHGPRLALGGAVGPALVPALATVVFLIHVDRSFQEAAREMASRELSRGLAVAASVSRVADPGTVRELTGFHAARVRNGRTEASSFPGSVDELAALPVPPPSFTASGAVDLSEGPSVYVALRLEEGAFLVTTSVLPEGRTAELRHRLLLVGLVLAGWWVLAAAGAWALGLSGGSGPRDPLRA